MSTNLLSSARQRRWSLLAIGVLMVALTACGDSPAPNPDADLPTETTTPPPDPTTTLSPEDEVLAAESAYLRFWEVWILANDPPDPDYPELDAVTTGAQRELVRANIAANKAEHVVYQDRPDSHRRHRLTVLGADAGTVVLEDCNVDDGLILDAPTHSIRNAEIATHLWRATVQLVGDSWKVADNSQEHRWAGVTSC